MRAVLIVFGALASVCFAQLPELKVEAVDGGSVLHLRNMGSQALTAYLIELVDYPGSSFALSQDEIGRDPVGPGQKRAIPTQNMTLGSAPDYVKVVAALYEDGTSAGETVKLAQLMERRRVLLKTIREILGRVERGESVASLREWANSIPAADTKTRRADPQLVNRLAMKTLIEGYAARLASDGTGPALAALRAREQALTLSKPPL